MRRLVVAGLLATVGSVTACPPTAAATPAAPPAVFDLQATAFLASVQSTQQPAASIITAGLIDSTAGYATSALRDGGAAESLASVAYPGDLVAGGPQLLCANLFPCPVDPPAYPLVADAAWPTAPKATDVTGQATSTAGASSTGATAAAPAPPDPTGVGLHWRSGSAESRAWVDGQGAHVLARSALHDVALGPLRIAELDSSDLVDISAAGRVTDRPAVVASGVTVAGESASLDQDGVHVAGQGAAAALSQLSAAGLSLRLLGASRHDGAGSARGAAGGLEVTISQAVSGVPVLPNAPSADRTYLATALLGGAGVAAVAGDDPALDLEQLPAVTDPLQRRVGPTTLPPATAQAPASGVLPMVTRPVTRAYPVVVSEGWRTTALTWDLSPVALALMVAPMALLVLWRAAVTMRRPS